MEDALEKLRTALRSNIEKVLPVHEEFLAYLDPLFVDPVKEFGDDYDKGYDKIQMKLEELYSKFVPIFDRISDLRDHAEDSMKKFQFLDLKNFSDQMEKEKIDLEKYKSIEAEFLEIFSVYKFF